MVPIHKHAVLVIPRPEVEERKVLRVCVDFVSLSLAVRLERPNPDVDVRREERFCECPGFTVIDRQYLQDHSIPLFSCFVR